MDELIFTSATRDDLPLLIKMEEMCFDDPWSEAILKSEIDNGMVYVCLAWCKEEAIGYACLWTIIDESHINNIAILPAWRGQGYGLQLINHLIEQARMNRSDAMTLEVRASNTPARTLYEKVGFVSEGIRPRYYEDGEDAEIMWLYDLQKK